MAVGFDCARRGVTTYSITPVSPTSRQPKNGWIASKEREHLKKLAPKIERVARKELGTYFLQLENVNNLFLLLNVRSGTRTAKHFTLRSLLGWIELCGAK